MPDVLLTGGTGLLGRELRKLSGEYAVEFATPDSHRLDVRSRDDWLECIREQKPILIVHAAAFTDVVGAERVREVCYDTNAVGTAHGAEVASDQGIPFIYICTEYVFPGDRGLYKEIDEPKPINYYARTKLVGEQSVLERGGISVRLLFKPSVWEYPAAFTDQWTSGDYVDVIARELLTLIRAHGDLILEITARTGGLIHIGTGRKSIYELAKRRNPEVLPTTRDAAPVILPRDTSLDHSMWDEMKAQL